MTHCKEFARIIKRRIQHRLRSNLTLGMMSEPFRMRFFKRVIDITRALVLLDR